MTACNTVSEPAWYWGACTIPNCICTCILFLLLPRSIRYRHLSYCPLQLSHEPACTSARPNIGEATRTYHLTLAHKHPSIAISAMMWKFPRVRIRRPKNTQSRRANAPSNRSRKVGLRDEPGVKMLERKPAAPSSEVVSWECVWSSCDIAWRS